MRKEKKRMSDNVSALTKSTGPAVGLDGNATNIRHRGNMFAPEVVLSEKDKLRKLVQDNADSVKEVSFILLNVDLLRLYHPFP